MENKNFFNDNGLTRTDRFAVDILKNMGDIIATNPLKGCMLVSMAREHIQNRNKEQVQKWNAGG